MPTASAKSTRTEKSANTKTTTAKKTATAKTKSNTKVSTKPVSLERFGVERLLAGHPAMRQLRDEGHIPSIHGTKHWPSADLLIDYLQENPLKKKAGVIDAGCGWGIGGIYCAKNFKSKVTAVDADDAVFPFLQAHAKLNGVKIETLKKKFQNVKKDALEDVHAVIGADICFWDELVKPLLKLIDRSLDSGAKRVMIADPGRSPFYVLAEKCIKRYDADLVDWRSDAYPRISGSILVIDHRK